MWRLPAFYLFQAGCLGKQQIGLQASTSTHLRDRNGEYIGHQDQQ